LKARFPSSLVLLLCSGLAHADIYRFQNAEGSTVFSDIRPTGRKYEVVVKSPRPPAQRTRADEDGARAAAVLPRISALDRARYAVHINEAARANHVDPALIHAVISAESGYNAAARSPKGALGLMQLMPDTARRYSVRNSLDPVQNIYGGVRYLADLLRMFNNDLKLVIAAYNAGENAVVKYGNRVPPYAETRAYVPRVLGYYRKYRGLP
jgi:soluble lytic murein transglycosylase-like protein